MFHTAAAALGVSEQNSLDVNFVTVPKSNDDCPIGTIATLNHPDKPSKTCSISYDQLEQLLSNG